MVRAAAALEAPLIASGVGGELVGARPKVGSELGPTRIVALEQTVTSARERRTPGQILGVGRLGPPLEPIAGVDWPPVDGGQDVERRAHARGLLEPAAATRV